MVGRLNPLAAILAGGDDQLSGQLTGYLQNAATSNGQGQENIQSFYEQAGLSDRQQAIDMVNQLKESGAIDDWEQVAYHNAINMQFGDDGSGSYDYSKLGQGPDASHKAAYDLSFPNSEPSFEGASIPTSGESYELVGAQDDSGRSSLTQEMIAQVTQKPTAETISAVEQAFSSGNVSAAPMPTVGADFISQLSPDLQKMIQEEMAKQG